MSPWVHLDGHSFSGFPCFDNLDSLQKKWLGISQNVLQLRFVWFFFFFMIRLELQVWGRKAMLKCNSHHIILSAWFITFDIILVKLQCLTILSILKLSFPSLFLYCTLMKAVTVHAQGVELYLLKKEYLYKLYGMFLHGLFVYFPPYIYLFNHLSISAGTKGYF